MRFTQFSMLSELLDMTTTAPVDTRSMGVGTSHEEDADVAPRAALATAAGGRTPALVLLFVSPWFDVHAVARTAREVLGPQIPVAGSTTAAEIAGTSAGSGNVVTVAIGGPGLEVRTAVGSLEDEPRAAGAQAAGALLEVDGQHRALMLLAGGPAGEGADVVRGAYAVVGAGIPLVSGCAGDELATIVEHLPGVPLAGSHTYGEFAQTRGARGVPNATLALLAMG
ncbi:FIST N-terminal domain-containing protein [Cellulomonas bogoriensis]|uniref:FIST domain-containing protein n=1 Tax=Cellulomonas bogoriensis 69B4 = DSM 16987 TaxID=1386082 RepID=A0A0A0BZ18_9CELL|nr:FIST N-terminal domain-containing protein [Cellulomonas bogoriensis]KGM13156.1 hypothetical protein N869_15760 [Cellulomonas bogoriensis 69B4 = DSM 16987]